jgi:hypothetical protein
MTGNLPARSTGPSALPARPQRAHGGSPDVRGSQHCVLLAVDVAGFTDAGRDDRVQLAIRAELYRLVKEVFDDSLLGWADCIHEDRGDGIVVIVPARMPSARVVDPLAALLARRLAAHNALAREAYRIRLRVAVHIGEVHRDGQGLAGTAVNHLFRLLDAPVLKRALADSGADLALIASDYFYDSVLRHGPGTVDPGAFWPAAVQVKQTRTRGWIHLPQVPRGTEALRAPLPPPPGVTILGEVASDTDEPPVFG